MKPADHKEVIVWEDYARMCWDFRDIVSRARIGHFGPTLDHHKVVGNYALFVRRNDPVFGLAEGDVIVLKRNGGLKDKRLTVIKNEGLGELELKDEWWERRERAAA